jgi:hypothetical protein
VIYTRAPPPPAVQICPGQFADPTASSNAKSAIQACIAQTPAGGVLELPVGNYLIDGIGALTINKQMTLRTAGTANVTQNCETTRCAALLAGPQLQPDINNCRAELNPAGVSECVFFALLRIGRENDNISADPTGVVIDHIIVDGNRSARWASAAALKRRGALSNPPPHDQKPKAINGRWAYNIQVRESTSCKFIHSKSINAPCGSSLEWTGDTAEIANSVFRGNGDYNTKHMWADGLTLLRSHGSWVVTNSFIDNSDVRMVVGRAQNANFVPNTLRQQQQSIFAFSPLDTFGTNAEQAAQNGTGNFTGTKIRNYSIQCGSCTPSNAATCGSSCNLCSFGANLGPNGWHNPNGSPAANPNVYGAQFYSSTVYRGYGALAVLGGGAPPPTPPGTTGPLTIHSNVLWTKGDGQPFCGGNLGKHFSVDHDSWLDPGYTQAPAPAGQDVACHRLEPGKATARSSSHPIPALAGSRGGPSASEPCAVDNPATSDV